MAESEIKEVTRSLLIDLLDRGARISQVSTFLEPDCDDEFLLGLDYQVMLEHEHAAPHVALFIEVRSDRTNDIERLASRRRWLCKGPRIHPLLVDMMADLSHLRMPGSKSPPKAQHAPRYLADWEKYHTAFALPGLSIGSLLRVQGNNRRIVGLDIARRPKPVVALGEGPDSRWFKMSEAQAQAALANANKWSARQVKAPKTTPQAPKEWLYICDECDRRYWVSLRRARAIWAEDDAGMCPQDGYGCGEMMPPDFNALTPDEQKRAIASGIFTEKGLARRIPM